ncbi:MAG: B12-binding domain-containing radical SAM protein [Promethearchaeota archaeon]
MKILLVNPNSRGSIGLNSFLTAPPLALMYLSAALKPAHEVQIVDMKYRNENVNRDVTRKIEWADLVALTSFTPSIKNALELAQLAKGLGKPTILGGYHASLLPETVLDPSVDVTVQGEGEVTFPELVDALETHDLEWDHAWLKGVRGVSYVKGDSSRGELVSTEERPLLKNLDDLPFPDREITRKNKYKYFGASIDSLESARGCWGQCNFCCVRSHWRGKWRAKSPNRVIREIATMNQRRRWFTFQDSEFTMNMRRVDKIFEYIRQYGYDQRWYSAQGRLDDVVKHPDVVARMADGGFKMLFVGIESVYQKSLDVIGKHMNLGQIREGIRILHDNGITVFGAIIIGNLGESYDMVEKTIHFARDLNVDICQFTALTPLPSTPLYEQAKANGWIDDYDWTHYDFCDPVMHTPDLSTREIRELVIKAYNDFYLSSDYLLRKGRQFIPNRKFHWFFKMLPGFLLQANRVSKFVRSLQVRQAGDARGKQVNRSALASHDDLPLLATPPEVGVETKSR